MARAVIGSARLLILLDIGSAPREQVPSSGCGRTAAEKVAGLPARQRRAAFDVATGDLAVSWLLADGRRFHPARFCADCAPSGTPVDVSCARCAEGPLVAAGDQPALPGMPADQALRDDAVGHLGQQGWELLEASGLVCPDCRF